MPSLSSLSDGQILELYAKYPSSRKGIDEYLKGFGSVIIEVPGGFLFRRWG